MCGIIEGRGTQLRVAPVSIFKASTSSGEVELVMKNRIKEQKLSKNHSHCGKKIDPYSAYRPRLKAWTFVFKKSCTKASGLAFLKDFEDFLSSSKRLEFDIHEDCSLRGFLFGKENVDDGERYQTARLISIEKIDINSSLSDQAKFEMAAKLEASFKPPVARTIYRATTIGYKRFYFLEEDQNENLVFGIRED